MGWLVFVSGKRVGVFGWGTFVLGWFKVLVPLQVRVVWCEGSQRLTGTVDRRKGFYGRFGVRARQ